jgi:DNA polymerase III epsilon subunit-like protein
MIYLSIDTETTGLDADFNQVLSVGIIIEDSSNPKPYSELPKFHCAIIYHEVFGSLYALNMNRELIGSINSYMCAKTIQETERIEKETGMCFLHKHEVVPAIKQFLLENGFTYDASGRIYLTCAGKNFGTFDKRFLEKLPHWKEVFGIHSRILDPGILYVDWTNDTIAPSMNECKVRSGLSGFVTHNALEDAWDVVQLLRKKY